MAAPKHTISQRLATLRDEVDALERDNGLEGKHPSILEELTRLEQSVASIRDSHIKHGSKPQTLLTPEGEDEFGLDSDDEAQLLQLPQTTAGAPRSMKRKSGDSGDEPVKRVKSDGVVAVAESVLQQRFNMQAFRLKQEQAIARLLEGGSAVVVFPTGGGKSLCYQVPALCFREIDRQAGVRQGHAESGITLIVSPLIALMKDQVDALKRRNISAAVLDSTKSKEEYLETIGRMRQGTLDILYCAPERLNNEGFVTSMAHVKGGVRLLAVDEAHCISEWGHAFRPDYLKVSRFAKEIEAERVVCLTATATPKVAEDVCKAFDIPEEGLFRTPTYRPNLRLLAESYLTKKASYPRLTKFLKANKGPTIIYVTLQKHSEQLAEDLRNSGFKARHFHAGMPVAEKTACQEAFMAAEDLIIVATIAFGMGIDKANIRNVVHYDIPQSLEGYSQEIGRAGRDGLQSNCMLFLCAEDLHLRESFARGDLPSKQSVESFLENAFHDQPTGYVKDGFIEAPLYTQSKNHDIKVTVLKNIYAQLELRFGLIRESTPKYTSYTYAVLKPTQHDKSPAAAAIRNVEYKAKKLVHVDIDAAERKSRLSRREIVAKLNDWHDEQLIDLKTSGVVNMYRVLKTLPKTPAQQQRIVDDLYADLEYREQQNLDRMKQVMDLVNGEACFSRTLAEHFGDSLPNGGEDCGHCTWCETHEAVKTITPEPKPFNQKLFRQILDEVPERDDPRFLARVAFGIGSPRLTQEKLAQKPIFGSMEDYDFMVLLNAFTKVCKEADGG